MAMDVLRSAHTSDAVIGADGETTAELRWYKCREGAKAFPHFHAFGNPVWEPHPDEWTQGPGVLLPAVKWVPSVIPAPPGIEFHGELAWYQKGIPQEVFDDPEPHEHPPCVPEPLVVTVGIGIGVAFSPVENADVWVTVGAVFVDGFQIF